MCEICSQFNPFQFDWLHVASELDVEAPALPDEAVTVGDDFLPADTLTLSPGSQDDAGEDTGAAVSSGFAAARAAAETTATTVDTLDATADAASSTSSTPVADNGKPIYTNDQIADQLINGYWESSGQSARSWADIDLGNSSTADNVLYVDYSAMAANGKYFVELALDIWSSVTGLIFSTSVPSGLSADITFDDAYSGAYTLTYGGNGEIRSAAINIASNWYGNVEGQLLSYTLQTVIHEMGHALGLGHAGNYNGSSSYSSGAEFANDSWQTSIMSYFSQTQNTYTDASYAYVFTPMVADILAIQEIYGTAGTLRTANTVYGVGSTAGDAYDLLEDVWTKVAFTIIDDGGTDTVNFSSTSKDQVIDLNQEAFSNVGGKVGNMSIARGTVIENAVSGSGNDTLIGNGAANVLNGGAGNDTFVAGARDTVIGGSGTDTLDLRGLGTVAVTYNSGSTTDGTATLAGGKKVTFTGIEKILADKMTTDTGTSTGTDTGSSTGTDTGSSTGTDTGSSTGTDTGTSTGTDTGSSTGTDTGTSTGTDTGNPSSTSALDFASLETKGFLSGTQDKGDYTLSADGLTLVQESQSWEQILGSFTVTADTHLTFDFSADTEGEIHAIMFTNGENLSEATTIQLFGSQDYGIQDFNTYKAGSGTQSFDIAVGDYFTGKFDRIVFLTDQDSGNGADSTWANVALDGGTTTLSTSALDFASLETKGFLSGTQDKGDYTLSDDGLTLVQESQSWEQVLGDFTVTADTHLTFDFSADTEGEIHAIMFTNGENLSKATTIQLFGSQNYGIQDFNIYEAGSGTQSFDIAVGDYFTGKFDRIVFLTDQDSGSGADSTWANVVLNGATTTPSTSALDFASLETKGFQSGTQDKGDYTLSANGLTLVQESQSWEQMRGDFTVTADTHLAFDFSADTEGEIHAIMFTKGENLSEATTIQLLGSQDYGIQDFNTYEAGSGTQSFDIAVGDYFTGEFDRIVFLTDQDFGSGADSTWANVEFG